MKLFKLTLRWIIFAPMFLIIAPLWLFLGWLTEDGGYWPFIRDDFKRQFLTKF